MERVSWKGNIAEHRIEVIVVKLKKMDEKKDIKRQRRYQKIIDDFKKGMEEDRGKAKEEKPIQQKGFLKKRLFGLGWRPYKSPIVLYIRDTGEIEIEENARSGYLIKKLDGGEQRCHVLDPVKLRNFPCAFGEPLQGWIVAENDAFALPNSPVLDAELFNKIKAQDEQQAMDDALQMAKFDVKKIGIIVFGVILVVGLLINNPNLINNLIGGIFPQAQQTAQTVTTAVVG